MVGAMDLTTEVDEVDDAVFDETGTFVASFMLNGEIVGEIEVPVFVQSAPVKLSKDAEDGLKKSDVIWVGTESPNGRRRTVRRGSPTRTERSTSCPNGSPGRMSDDPGGAGGEPARDHHASEAP